MKHLLLAKTKLYIPQSQSAVFHKIFQKFRTMKPLKILICPLNWGLGHATRCIPIIRYLLQQGCEPIIATDGRAAQLLKTEFPHLQHLHLTGYDLQFPNSQQNLAITLAKQLPKIFYRIVQEHQELQQIITKYGIQCVISDNRYGCWTKKCPTVFMTHQIFVRLPPPLSVIQPLLWRLNRWFLQRYDHVWIPDEANAIINLSGELSHPQAQQSLPRNCQYIGILSRFEPPDEGETGLAKQYDITVLLSGVEPQRTELENILLEQLQHYPVPKRILFVRGITETNSRQNITPQITFIDHLNSDELRAVLLQSDIIITRSGYTTLMDLVQLNKTALLIPTPQQTEQEYLATYLQNQQLFVSTSQSNVDLAQSIAKLINWQRPFFANTEKQTFSKNIQELLKQLV